MGYEWGFYGGFSWDIDGTLLVIFMGSDSVTLVLHLRRGNKKTEFLPSKWSWQCLVSTLDPHSFLLCMGRNVQRFGDPQFLVVSWFNTQSRYRSTCHTSNR